MPRCYIAGPMRGYEKFNFDAFDAARDRGKVLGWDICSPADMDREMGFDGTQSIENFKFNLKAAIIRDIIAVCGCNAIALLPNWENSSGARVELAAAQFLGLPVLNAFDFKPMLAFIRCETVARRDAY